MLLLSIRGIVLSRLLLYGVTQQRFQRTYDRQHHNILSISDSLFLYSQGLTIDRAQIELGRVFEYGKSSVAI